MHITFLTPTQPNRPDKDGMTLIAYHIVKALSDRHTFDVLHLDGFIKPSRFSYFLSGSWKRHGWFQYRYWSESMAQTIRQIDEEGKTDVFVIHSPFLSAYIDTVNKTRVVHTPIDAFSLWFSQMAVQARLPLQRMHFRREAGFARQLERKVFPKARSVVVVSDRDAEAVRQSSPDARVTVIPNGVDAEGLTSGSESGKPSLVFSGVMDYPPNVDAVLTFAKRIWPRLARDHAGLTWTIAGKNPVPDVVALGKRDPRIRVTGWVDDIRPYIQEASLVLAPLNIATGIQNKILEAFACGKVVLATAQAAAGCPTSIRENLELCSTVETWSNAVRRYIENPMVRRAHGERNHAAVMPYSWEATARAYEKIFSDAIS